jgi:hypothetical protein
VLTRSFALRDFRNALKTNGYLVGLDDTSCSSCILLGILVCNPLNVVIAHAEGASEVDRVGDSASRYAERFDLVFAVC